ncbi:hypothetical protein MRX96_000710 [Rhipicephalus microplus]
MQENNRDQFLVSASASPVRTFEELSNFFTARFLVKTTGSRKEGIERAPITYSHAELRQALNGASVHSWPLFYEPFTNPMIRAKSNRCKTHFHFPHHSSCY